jgi:hypothetical protein
MRKLALIFLLGSLALPLALVRPAYAADCNEAETVFGGDYTLEGGETLEGNLVVMGGSVIIEEEATVECAVVVVGGSVDIAGHVGEDVAIIGGSVDLRSTAVVDGELTILGGAQSQEEGAEVKGGTSRGFGPIIVRPRIDLPGRFDVFNPAVQLATSVIGAFVGSTIVAMLALLVALFWPQQTARVSAAITSAPAASGTLGFLTLIAVPTVLVLVTLISLLCLSPLTFIGALVFVAAIIFGWLALGMLIGARLTAALNLRNLSPAVSAALGTFLLTLVASVFDVMGNVVGWLAWWAECFAFVVPLILVCIGLGAVVLTRFGTQPYLANLPAQPPAPPPTESTPPPAEVTAAS